MSASGTCIVTGGAGFIGCAISGGLVDRFARVIAVDCLHPQIHPSRQRPSALHPQVELVTADITEAKTWDDLLARVTPTVVVHLAAETGTGQSLTEASRHAHVNVTGTTQLLDGLARAQVVPAQILLTSSRAVYGEGPWQPREGGPPRYPGQRTREQLAAGSWDFEGLTPVAAEAAITQPSPVSVYGATKLAQEHILAAWATAFGAATKVVRLQNVYGPGQSLSNSYTGIVSLFCRLARGGESIPLYEDGAMLRDFILIDDVASAILATLDCGSATGVTLDIGTGHACSIADLAERIARHYGAPAPHVCAKFRFGDVRHASCRTTRTQQVLGWQSRFDPDAGIARLAAWIETQLPPA